MPIRFLNLNTQFEEIEAEAREAVERVLASGAYILGREVEAFEREWARVCGARACAGVGNGTDALALALQASGAVRPGRRDEVITSPLTAGYTALAILNAGGVPVFADVDARTLTLDPRAVEEATTPRTRAVLPVHLYGRMADMHAFEEIARRRGLVLIEDAAQAHGASLDGRRAGAWGHAAAFSFYPTKNLGAFGDGGAVVSNDVSLIERVRELRQGGHAEAMRGRMQGRNSRLDEVQAALLRLKLKRLAVWTRRRQRLAGEYRKRLARAQGLELLPPTRERASHVYHLFVARTPERERLRAHLAARGVETLIHYPRLLHTQPLFRRRGQRALPVAERAVEEIVSLPLYPHLLDEELRAVCDAILEFEA